ncbi:hypothetical protein Q8A67_006398 [Cirrhinus molitorella]|nr:hypothetical protein Q8A67_006398 [Cirrhinus molitorella]
MWRSTCVTLALLILDPAVCLTGPLLPRIAGGVDTVKGVWPWMASLHTQSHFCGGSLISSEWVLSAAHCFFSNSKFDVQVHKLKVYLGMWTQEMQHNSNVIQSDVRSIHTHNAYDEKTFDNDIALVRLSSPTSAYSPVLLAAQGSVIPSGTLSWITGWGQTASKGFFGMRPKDLPAPQILQQAVISVVDNVQCHDLLKNKRRYTRITVNMICAGIPAGGVDTYCGDSGGPLMHRYDSQWVQSGITSFGYGCAKRNTPGVYTRVSQYQQWITDIIRNQQSQNFPRFVNFPLPSAGQSSVVG